MTGRTILLVEDEILVALHLVTLLEEAHWQVVGPLATVPAALAAVTERADLTGAILDINLGGNLSWPIARALLARRVPFLFLSGYAPAHANVPADLAHAELLAKPVSTDQLSPALAKFTAGARIP